MESVRLALLIPDRVIRSGVEGLIRARGQTPYTVVVFDTFQTLAREVQDSDIVLMDVSGLRLETLESWLKQLIAGCPAVRVIVIGNQLKIQIIRFVLQLGAKGFIFRDDLSNVLLGSIDLVARNVITLSAQAQRLLTNTHQLQVGNELKPLDRQVLRLIACGLGVKAIAAELEVSTRSVYRSRDKLREILDVPTNETLLDAAREQGLLDWD